MKVRTLRRNSWVIVTSATIKDIRNMNARPRHQAHKYLKVTTTTIGSIDIEHMSANQILTGHQTSKPR